MSSFRFITNSRLRVTDCIYRSNECVYETIRFQTEQKKMKDGTFQRRTTHLPVNSDARFTVKYLPTESTAKSVKFSTEISMDEIKTVVTEKWPT